MTISGEGMMRREWCKRFTDSLVVLATAAVLPTLAFSSNTIESVVGDQIITTKIKNIFARHDFLVNVHTQEGIVYLTGTVENFEQCNVLIQLAKSVEGVRDVKVDIALK